MTHVLAASSPLEHVVQHPFLQYDIRLPIIGDTTFTFLSDQIIMQILAGLLVILVMRRAARSRAEGSEVERLTPRGFGNFIESICAYLRKHVAEPALGPHTDRFVPYIWTAFFFVLFSNLLGLIPFEPVTRYFIFHDSEFTHGHGIGGTSTGNVFVTGTLACCTLFMLVYNGLRINGIAYVKHFFMGPFPINLLIAALEVIGLGFKTFALMMRLFANMVSGHVLLAVLLSFIAMSTHALGTGPGFGIGVLVVLASVAISMLELFVACLQAFIFTFLTATFIGLAVNIHPDHDEHHEEGLAHAH